MRIEHVAMWVKDLEKIKEFYINYFNATSNEIYENTKKGFKSYFLSFEGDTRLEIMQRTDIREAEKINTFGFTHLAFSVGSKSKVDEFTNNIREAGYKILGEPRTTGDGYYESVILDPEGNTIEIVG